MEKSSFFSSFFLKKQSKQLLCEDPEYAFIIYKNFRINLLTGEKEDYLASEFLDFLECYSLDDDYTKPIVIHLFFEFGYLCAGLFNLIDRTKPLAILIKYKKSKTTSIFSAVENDDFSLSLLASPNFSEYEEKFNEVYKELIEGNCYQVNLTMPFYFRMKEEFSSVDFMAQLWRKTDKVGAFAHGTYIPSLDKLLVSNSPECLFKAKKINEHSYKLSSMPIKGTITLEDNQIEQDVIDELFSSKKDRAELFMIADLVRNDLAKIQFAPAKVKHKRLALKVPGLIHQYSHLCVDVSADCHLKQIVEALFPGGSITGAPKKRVMEITKRLENYSRGFYCGSTILLSENIKSASINIRSVEVDYSDNEVKYGAGGGVTLLSDARSEYNEMVAKMKSFLLLLTK